MSPLRSGCRARLLLSKAGTLHKQMVQVRSLRGAVPFCQHGKIRLALSVDILPRLKSGDSQRRQSCDCVPERVPASPRLPRGTRLGFRRKHSHVGNFTGTNQPPIPPGLTISPQADTACPAAVSPVSTLKAERQKFQLRGCPACFLILKVW